jgi:hypothetical protein
MARYIDGDKLKERMLKYYECLKERVKGRPYKGDTLMDYEVVDMIEDCIDSVPTADVAEVRHGRWEDRDGKTWCSLCQASNKQYKPPYCPHCGAKMDKGVIA